MSRFAALVTAAAGTAGTLSAVFLLPWALWGVLSIGLARFPMWGWYVGAAAVLHLCVAGHLAARGVGVRRLLLAVALLAAIATVASAIVVMRQYDDPAAFFDLSRPIIMVKPGLGFGGPVAVLAALVTAAALAGAGDSGLIRSKRLGATASPGQKAADPDVDT